MKFTDGYWRVKDGYSIFNATEIRDVCVEESRILVYAACRKVMTPGQTFNEPLITTEYSSPVDNVIRVRVWHHLGGKDRHPGFDLEESKPCGVTKIEQNQSSLTSGDFSVKIPLSGDWDIRYYYKDVYRTGTAYKSTAYITDNGKKPFMREQLHLSVGTTVYGLGEHFTPFSKNGQTFEMWNDDGGTCSEVAYKNVPFYITNKGYAVLVNNPGRVSFEVASENVSRVQFSVSGEILEYFIIGGENMASLLKTYTALSGKPALPPAWAFGLWLSTCAQPEQNEKVLWDNIQKMREYDIPFSVYHFDCFWMKEYQFCDFKWDKERYPNPEKMIAQLKNEGIHISVWSNPFISQKSELFTIGKEKGYFLKKKNGDIWQWDRWQNGMAIVDFTNPEAAEWYRQKIREVLRMGIDSIKMDFGERIPEDVVYYDGSDPERMHNYYAYLYQKTVFSVMEEERGKNNAVGFCRAGTAGCQKYPIHWGGDNSATYDSMAESLRGGLSLSLSGYGFWTHDISGFELYPSPDLYKRWVAFGLMSCVSRLHANTSVRLPWKFGEDCVEVLKYFVRLKHQLMPYFYASACETSITGLPFMRPMALAYENDLNCSSLDMQYMIGESLLVAPIFNEKGEVSYYLPEGNWTNFLSGKTVTGGKWITEIHDYFSLPLMIRPNAIIPVGKVSSVPNYDYEKEAVFHVFELENGKEALCDVYSQKGEKAYSLTVSRTDSIITASCSTGREDWKLLMRGIHNVETFAGAATTDTKDGVLVYPIDGMTNGEIKFEIRR